MLLLGAAPPEHLPQNWSADDWDWFYTTPQGSKLIPFNWATALERPYDDTLFLADSLARFGYLPNPKSSWNPDGLPVGFVRDPGLAGAHLGMTCAACHTNQIDYGGRSYQVDGAPTDADLFGFLAEISESLEATTVSATDPKFLRFAGRVLGKNNNRYSRAKLFTNLQGFSRYFFDFVSATTSNASWGRSRADAFGAIFNRVTAIDLNLPSNNRPPDAPVSYPFLWDTSWHDKVQWNGSAPNQLAVLRLARNVGEVLGVFADIKIKKPEFLHWYYESTANRINLLEMEDRLATLRSPRWPDAFPAMDTAKAADGKKIYDARCLSCHLIATPGVEQKVVMTPINSTDPNVPSVHTDPAMALLSATRQAKTGVLEGVPQFVIVGDKLGDTAGAGTITLNAVVGSILSPIPGDWYLGSPSSAKTQTANASTSTRNGEGSERDLRVDLLSPRHKSASKTTAENQIDRSDPVTGDLRDALGMAQQTSAELHALGLAYKARPLDGIWATAPYLHNGSVPTLRDLLKPAAQRPKTFYTGSRAFDPVNVGFDSGPGTDRFLFDTTKPSNSNAGHEWGPPLSTSEIDALIEYLKSL
jgi:hypothetical protein